MIKLHGFRLVITGERKFSTMKNITGTITLTFLFSLFILSSCRKQDQSNNDITAATNEALFMATERGYEDEVELFSRSASSSDQCNPLDYLVDCVEVTDSGVDVYPRDITLDFGSGCEGSNGAVRSGMIHISISGDMMEEGSVRTVTFDGFQVDNTQVAGSRITTSLGVNGDGNPMYTRVIDTEFTRNGNLLTRDLTQTVTWLSGHETAICGDNVFQIDGTGSVVRPNGNVVTRTTLEPVIIDRVCGYPVQGVILTNAPMGERTIDFGDGTCDNIAVVYVNGEEIEISLGE